MYGCFDSDNIVLFEKVSIKICVLLNDFVPHANVSLIFKRVKATLYNSFICLDI